MRLALTALGLAALLAAPLTANAATVPDDAYGTSGTATVTMGCTDTHEAGPSVTTGGRIFVVAQCAGGYHRVQVVKNDGKTDTTYGTNGVATFKMPTTCVGANTVLRPAKDGSLFVLTENAFPHPGNTSESLVCIAHLTSKGKVYPKYGGTTPVRKLDHQGGGYNSLFGADVDSQGRLLVFSQRTSTKWQKAAAFINRYTTAGKPDTTFSGDGQVSFTQQYQTFLDFGSALDTRPVIAVSYAEGGDTLSGDVSTAFVRFTASGKPDPTFGSKGKKVLRTKDAGGAQVQSVVLDPAGRLVLCVTHDSSLGGSSWFDVLRLGRTGASDAAFNAATTRVQAAAGVHIAFAYLQLADSRYAVAWEQQGTSTDTYGATGYNVDGSRWTALGPNGNLDGFGAQFAADAPAYYDFEYPGPGLKTLTITRTKIQ